MPQLIRRGESSHWYTKDGKPKHDADLRVARKEFLYPSVTSVDKAVFKNPFLESWMQDQILIAAGDNPRMPHENAKQYAQRIYDISMEKSRAAMEFGTKIHDACEKHPAEPGIELKPWFDLFSEWIAGDPGMYHERRILSRECTLVDHDIGIAGRTDLIMADITRGCYLGDTVVDYKTQDIKVDDKGRKTPKFYDSWVRQLAFYAACHSKNSGKWPNMPSCLSLIIDSNEGGIIYEKQWDRQEVIDAYRRFVHGAWLWFDDRNYWPAGKWTPELNKPLPL